MTKNNISPQQLLNENNFKNTTHKGVLMPDLEIHKNILIITSSGGGGLLQAAEAEKQLIEIQKKGAKVIKVDLLLEWVGGLFGNFGVNSWNKAQRSGKIFMQLVLGHSQRIAEYIFWPKIFFKTYSTLKKEDIDFIIDTQPLGLSAVIKAIKLYNKTHTKNVALRKVIVDLPTYKAVHFFRSVKKLSKKDKKYLTISTVEPLLDENETDLDFWQRHLNCQMDKICYLSYPVRCEFKKYENKEKNLEDLDLFIRTNSLEENEIIKKIVSFGSLSFLQKNKKIDYIINKNEYVITILLGSQPAFDAIKNYINVLIKTVQEFNFEKKISLFVFSAELKDNLFDKILNDISKTKNYPKNITIVPFSFQKEDVIAKLFFRSDMTITRSGGQTAIELMKVSNAKKFVHSEAKLKNDDFTKLDLLKGIPVWEAGNAEYMMKKMDAKLITPKLFKREIIKINQ
jgi:UDP-N-acetylglucosamine:LPS N-acetylglucosamine transferase